MTGVSVVTSFGREGPSGMTANAVTSLSLEPPLMLVCFDRTARTLGAVEHSGRIGIHFLAHDQEQVAARFASKLPEAEKFEGLGWSDRGGSTLSDAPQCGRDIGRRQRVRRKQRKETLGAERLEHRTATIIIVR